MKTKDLDAFSRSSMRALRQQRGQTPNPQSRSCSATKHLNALAVVFKVAIAKSLAANHFHLRMKTFGDAIVASQAPHGSDFRLPGMQRIAEYDQLRQAGLAELADGF